MGAGLIRWYEGVVSDGLSKNYATCENHSLLFMYFVFILPDGLIECLMGAGVTLGGNCLTTDLNSSSRLYFLMIVGGVVTGVQSSC